MSSSHPDCKGCHRCATCQVGTLDSDGLCRKCIGRNCQLSMKGVLENYAQDKSSKGQQAREVLFKYKNYLGDL